MHYTFEQLIRLGIGAPVLSSLETSNRHIGLIRLESPRNALVNEVFIFSQVDSAEQCRPLLHYAFLVVNCQDIGHDGITLSVCSVLDRTKIYNVTLPKKLINVSGNSFLVVNPAGVVIGCYLSARSFQREWPVLSMNFM